ncbi:alpha-endosulfine isoform 2-T4 [Sylvia borin]
MGHPNLPRVSPWRSSSAKTPGLCPHGSAALSSKKKKKKKLNCDYFCSQPPSIPPPFYSPVVHLNVFLFSAWVCPCFSGCSCQDWHFEGHWQCWGGAEGPQGAADAGVISCGWSQLMLPAGCGWVPPPPGAFPRRGQGRRRFLGLERSLPWGMSPHPLVLCAVPASLRPRSRTGGAAGPAHLKLHPLLRPLNGFRSPLANARASHCCPALLFTPRVLYASPSARTDWSGVMSLRRLLYVHWVELLSVRQLTRWRRWRPFWSRARAGRSGGNAEPPLAAMAAPLGTSAFTEETGQEKQQKYFDSGDYNMAKAKMKNKQLPSAGPDKNLVTGDHIPTPQDLPQRKSSLVTSKLAG